MNIISKHLLFVVFVAAVSLAAPLSAQTGPTHHPRTVTIRGNRPPAGAGERGDRRVVYYITNDTATGSHIPTVYRRYDGYTTTLNASFQSGASYSNSDIGLTGALNVGDALRKLDPAITTSR